MGKERPVAGGSGHESAITQSRNLPEISRRRTRKVLALVSAGLGAAAIAGAGYGYWTVAEQDSASPSCSSETIKYPPDLEREYFVPCKRISDFEPPQELVDPVDRLKWLEKEVEKIHPGGVAVFANELYAVGIIGDSTTQIWERPLPEGTMVIEAAKVTGKDDFKDKVKSAICDLKGFFNKGREVPLNITQIRKQVTIVLEFRGAKGLDLEKQRVLSEFRNSPDMQSIPECGEQK